MSDAAQEIVFYAAAAITAAVIVLSLAALAWLPSYLDAVGEDEDGESSIDPLD